MTKQNFNNFENNIRAQIKILKQKLDNIDKTLNIQEQILNLLNENTNSLLKEAAVYNNSTEEIMKRAFSSRKLPKSLFK